ncbi:MAG: glucose-6-phosphate isomerase [Halieaceae bacterium]|jgi:glucose-6-phosphate isomerase|nr:glucose-6-phosphate isomerase [Halieaceae bacterium]
MTAEDHAESWSGFDNAAELDRCWQELTALARELARESIADRFADDPERAESFSIEAAGLLLDYSKSRISRSARDTLLRLAELRGVPDATQAMFRGDRINESENRPVLHTALRDRSGRTVLVDGEDACALARAECDRMLAFVRRVHADEHRGATGEPLDTVVNIGIGGSDLGPQMVVEALRPYGLKGRRTFFVSNVDGQHLGDVLDQLDPARTLFIVASKTFTTQETMTNAASAVDWFLASGMAREDIATHFAALSTNSEAVQNFGIAPDNTFAFWDWVGGRYSLWSAIGLSIALHVGADAFLELLQGAYAMDRHFAEAPMTQNAPVLLALVGIWHRNLEGIGVHAVLPYDQHLHRLPAYLQQADMESNGKAVARSGRPAPLATGPVLFGEPGTNGQHAFYQLLHQGSDKVAADFIVAARSQREMGDHHARLLANALAQPRALMNGKALERVNDELRAAGLDEQAIAVLGPQKVFPGSRPSNTILMERLTPHSLGALIALYEHKIFVQGVIWGINSFDQWGVELGKELARELLPLIDGEGGDAAASLDPSTRRLLSWIRARRGAR